jgi:hypothetical protein
VVSAVAGFRRSRLGLSFHAMKKPYAYEALAALAATLAVALLVSGLMPFINPGFLELHQTGEYSPRMAFLVPTLLSLPMFGVAWSLNQKAQGIRRELKAAAPAVAEAPWARKLKWILFGIVMVLVLLAFLW